MLAHAIRRHEEIANGSGQVKQRLGTKRLHKLGDAPQLMQVVRDADERDGQQHVVVASTVVLAQHLEHLAGVLVAGHDGAAVRPFLQEIEEAIGRMAVVAREGQQGELSVQEEDGVAGFEEIFGRGGAARARREVVDEADGLLLEGDGGAAAGYQH